MEEETETVPKILGTCSSIDLSLLELSTNDVDSIFATLEEAMEFEEIECRIVVSSMVKDAITRGVISALAEESGEQLANKDLELRKMRDILKSNEAKIATLERDLLLKQQESSIHSEENAVQRQRQTMNYSPEKKQMQEKSGESKSLVAQKEKELTEMASILEAESKRAEMLEKQLKELQLKHSLRLEEMAGLHEEMEKMEGEHDYLYPRLEYQYQPKKPKLNDIFGPGAEEVAANPINKQEVIIPEKTNKVTNLEVLLSEKDKLIVNLERQLRGENLEANVERAIRNAGKPFQAEHDSSALTEQLEEQKFRSEAEEELLICLFEGKLLNMVRELEQETENLEECTMKWKKFEEYSILQDLNSSLKGILDGMEKTLSSQKELEDRKRGTFFGKHELLGKVDAELSFLKEKINEMSSFSTWQKEAFACTKEEMNEQRWRFEVENQFLCTYWQSLIKIVQTENANLCKELSETKQMLNSSELKASELTNLMKEVVQVAGPETSLQDLAIELEGRLEIKDAEVLCLMESLEESRWRSDVEVMLILSFMEGLSREIIMELYVCGQEIGLKDEENFSLALEVHHLKRVLEGLENDFAAMNSLYLMPVIDDGSLEEVSTARILQERSDIILQVNDSPEEAAGGELATFSEAREPLKSQTMISEELEANKIILSQMMENLAEKKIVHEMEMDVSTEILEQKYQEASHKVMASKFTSDATTLQATIQNRAANVLDKSMCLKNTELTVLQNEFDISKRCLEELKVQLESFIYSSSFQLNEFETKCSILLGKCENIGRALEILYKQAKEMKKKKYVLQEEVNQQEWRQEIEDEFMLLVLRESLGEFLRSLKEADSHRQDTDLCGRFIQKGEALPALAIDEDNWKSNQDLSHGVVLKYVQFPVVGNASKDDLISNLKREVAELKREKEHALELKTEEIYKLKREFWKATEKRKEGLHASNNKDAEGLSKWFSEGAALLENMYNEAGLLEGDTTASKLREEWFTEKVSLLENISLKEREVEEATAKVSELTAVEKSQRATISKLSARVTELETEKEQLVLQWKNEQSLFSKSTKEWETEKEELRKEWETEKKELLSTVLKSDRTIRHLDEKLAMMLEEQKTHDAVKSQLQGSIDELECEKRQLDAECRRLSLSGSQLREELEAEKASLHNLMSQKERDLENLFADFTEQAGRESRLIEHIEELEIEKSELLCKESVLVEKVSELSAVVEKLETERKQLLENELFRTRKLNEEWQIQKATLLETISQKERNFKEVSEKLSELLQKDENHTITEANLLAHIEDLANEKEQIIASQREKESLATSLFREKDEAIASAVRNKREEEERCKILEKEVQDLLNKVHKLKEVVEVSKQDMGQGNILLYFAEQMDQFSESSQRTENEISQKMQENFVRLDRIREEFLKLNRHLKHSAVRESRLKGRLFREINNIRKAEAEVDLLADEVDVLVDLLKKAYAVLDLYSPVFQHYPEVTDIAKILSQELELRIDPM